MLHGRFWRRLQLTPGLCVRDAGNQRFNLTPDLTYGTVRPKVASTCCPVRLTAGHICYEWVIEAQVRCLDQGAVRIRPILNEQAFVMRLASMLDTSQSFLYKISLFAPQSYLLLRVFLSTTDVPSIKELPASDGK